MYPTLSFTSERSRCEAQVTPHRSKARWRRCGSARHRFTAQNFSIRALDAARDCRIPTSDLFRWRFTNSRNSKFSGTPKFCAIPRANNSNYGSEWSGAKTQNWLALQLAEVHCTVWSLPRTLCWPIETAPTATTARNLPPLNHPFFLRLCPSFSLCSRLATHGVQSQTF